MTTETAHRAGAAGHADGMGTWAVLLPAERYEAERLVHHDTLELTGLADVARPGPGRPGGGAGRRAAAAGGARPGHRAGSTPPGRPGRPAVRPVEPGTLVVAYTRRAFDEPVPADLLTLDGPVTALEPAAFRALADQLGPPPARRTWLVSLDLPIEAGTPAEAVRLFWSYVQELGPRELPAFVSPAGDELAMQAFVLGEEANQDPEEDD